jgi:membrane associated rhomboid family serine protease
MQKPPKWTEFPRYPVIAGTALIAIGVTAASWAGLDVSRLFETAMIRRGEVWRLVTSIFPHISVLHLVFNIYWLWAFGPLVEQVYGHVKTAALILLFAVVPNALEYAFASGGVGLSGVGYGLFGLLWVLSTRDERFHEAIDPKTIRLFVGWFFLCIVLTVAKILPVGNIAHGSGAVLGVLAGFAITQPERRPVITAGISLILVFSLWAATVGRPKVNMSQAPGYPEGKAGYDALMANRNQEAVVWLQEAVAAEPKNTYYWLNLALAYQRLGNDAQALTAYRKAADLGSIDGDNNVAWILATSSNPAIRNPAAALEYAKKAVASEMKAPNASHLDTLAEAYYVNGRYHDAVETEQQALALSPAEDRHDYENSLAKYQRALLDSREPAGKKK